MTQGNQTKKKYEFATVLAAIMVRVVFVWLAAFVWNPFHFNVGQQWFAAIVLFELDTTQWHAYRATAKLKDLADTNAFGNLVAAAFRKSP